MKLEIRYLLSAFLFCTCYGAFASSPFFHPGVLAEQDTIKTKDRGVINLVKDDAPLINEIFNTGARDMFAEKDMAAPQVQMVPDSVIKRRLALLDARSPITLEFNPEVRASINLYLGRYKNLVARMVGLSMYYDDLFCTMLDRYGVPLELKNLVVIESALNPKARSKAGATGLWQFMYSTGKLYGLYNDSYVDERFDPCKSTEAAAKMLRRLYDDYKDWNLVLAAYNYGSGNVNKAIARSGGKRNYWEVRNYMPLETRRYVGQFIAANYIMTYYREHGIVPELPHITYEQTDTVNVKGMLSFDLLSEKLDMPVTDIQFLNPGFKLNAVPYTPTRHYSLVLPADKAQKFAAIESEIYQQANQTESELKKTLSYKAASTAAVSAQGSITYRVKKGDTMGAIAMRYGVTVTKLKSWNHLSSTRLSIGQRLKIYPKK